LAEAVSAPPLRVRHEGAVAWLTLDRPARHNALTLELLEALGAALAAVVAGATTRVVVVSGAGPSFCSGADLVETAALLAGADRDDYLRRTFAVLRTLDELPLPTIAAVHGHVLAGGCELAMVCDLVVAGIDAVFGLPETELGMLPVVALTRGRARPAPGVLARMVLAGDRLDAPQALRAGLADVLAPAGEHLAEAARLAEAIAERDATAVAAATALMRAAPDDAAALAAAAQTMGVRR
jgi:enoyl-CoA hydratase